MDLNQLRFLFVLIPHFFLAGAYGQRDTTIIIKNKPFDFIFIEKGTYKRPSNATGDSILVEVKEPYWLGKYEITWHQWKAFMGWDDGRNQPDYPARRFTWFQLKTFADSLSYHSGLKFRLPTEAEWEYACISGLTYRINEKPFGFMWVRENAHGVIKKTGSTEPDGLGLFDLRGNVWEYTSSWFDPKVFFLRELNNKSYSEKVRKGGSSVYPSSCATCFYRYQNPPDKGNGNIGGRLLLEIGNDPE